jgi:hypothetical protein
MTLRSWPFVGAAAAVLCTGLLVACARALINTTQPPMQTFTNPHVVPEDTGVRVPSTYFLRRAWVQITRDLSRTEVPPTVPLDIEAMTQRPFAVSWLGHSAMLMRVGGLWVLLGPVLTDTAGPVAGFGPARLTLLPVGARWTPAHRRSADVAGPLRSSGPARRAPSGPTTRRVATLLCESGPAVLVRRPRAGPGAIPTKPTGVFT